MKQKRTTSSKGHTKNCETLVRKYLENQNWEIDFGNTLDYFNEIKNSCYSPKTYRDHVLMVRDFLRFYEVEWANKIKLPKIPRQLPTLVKEEQIRKLLEGIEKVEDPVKRQRLKAFTILGATTGMRSEEMYRITPEQIDLESRRIHLKNTKTGDDRMVFFNEQASQELEKLMSMDSMPLFVKTTTQRFYRSMKDETNGLIAKHLRKYFSATCDKLGMPTGVKKRLMGHSINGDIDLLHYSALAFDDLKAIYDRYWKEVQISL